MFASLTFLAYHACLRLAWIGFPSATVDDPHIGRPHEEANAVLEEDI
jgi:hypothetical protein